MEEPPERRLRDDVSGAASGGPPGVLGDRNLSCLRRIARCRPTNVPGFTIGGASRVRFLASNSPDIRFGGPGPDEYAIKSKKSLLPYALYIYADAATGVKIVH